MKILVTGATGCLGSVVTNHLAARGNAVTGTGRNARLAECLSPAVSFVAGDLTDRSFVEQIVRRHDAIVHCAGLSSLWGSAQEFEQANVGATTNLLETAVAEDVSKFIFISTPSVYFDFQNRLQIKETDALAAKPVNQYVVSKLECEQLVAHAGRRGLQTVTLRPRAIFGPHDRSLMPRLLKLANRGWLPLIDGGKAEIDVTYVDNVAHAVGLALEHLPQVSGSIYNVSNGETITVSTLFRKIIREFGLKASCVSIPYEAAYAMAATMEAISSITPGRPEPILTRYSVGVLARSQTLSLDAVRRDIGYEPVVSLNDGIKLTARAFLGLRGKELVKSNA